MGTFIEDPLSGRKQTVSSTFRSNVSAKTNPRIFYASRDDGLAFNCISDYATAAAGEYVVYLKNTSDTRNMFIRSIEFHSVQAVKWIVWHVSGTAAGGSEIIPSNLNLGSSLFSESTSRGDGAITGLTNIKQIGTHRTDTNGDSEMEYTDALILPPNAAIAVEYDIGTTGAAEVDIFFHYENIGFK